MMFAAFWSAKVDNIYWTLEVADAIDKGQLAKYYEVWASDCCSFVLRMSFASGDVNFL